MKKNLGIFALIVVLPISIYFAKHSSITSVKIGCSILAAAGFVFIGITQHGIIKRMDELQKTIRLEIYSYSFIGFLTFLGLFMIMQESFKFSLDASDVIVIILFGVSLIQLITTILIKKKYN